MLEMRENSRTNSLLTVKLSLPKAWYESRAALEDGQDFTIGTTMTQTPTHVKEAAKKLERYLQDNGFACAETIEEIFMEHLPKPSEWVDVRDRLPEQAGRYWAYSTELGDGEYTYREGQWGIGICTVTHWMPLPQPPAQKEKV